MPCRTAERDTSCEIIQPPEAAWIASEKLKLPQLIEGPGDSSTADGCRGKTAGTDELGAFVPIPSTSTDRPASLNASAITCTASCQSFGYSFKDSPRTPVFTNTSNGGSIASQSQSTTPIMSPAPASQQQSTAQSSTAAPFPSLRSVGSTAKVLPVNFSPFENQPPSAAYAAWPPVAVSSTGQQQVASNGHVGHSHHNTRAPSATCAPGHRSTAPAVLDEGTMDTLTCLPLPPAPSSDEGSAHLKPRVAPGEDSPAMHRSSPSPSLAPVPAFSRHGPPSPRRPTRTHAHPVGPAGAASAAAAAAVAAPRSFQPAALQSHHMHGRHQLGLHALNPSPEVHGQSSPERPVTRGVHASKLALKGTRGPTAAYTADGPSSVPHSSASSLVMVPPMPAGLTAGDRHPHRSSSGAPISLMHGAQQPGNAVKSASSTPTASGMETPSTDSYLVVHPRSQGALASAPPSSQLLSLSSASPGLHLPVERSVPSMPSIPSMHSDASASERPAGPPSHEYLHSRAASISASDRQLTTTTASSVTVTGGPPVTMDMNGIAPKVAYAAPAPQSLSQGRQTPTVDLAVAAVRGGMAMSPQQSAPLEQQGSELTDQSLLAPIDVSFVFGDSSFAEAHAEHAMASMAEVTNARVKEYLSHSQSITAAGLAARPRSDDGGERGPCEHRSRRGQGRRARNDEEITLRGPNGIKHPSRGQQVPAQRRELPGGADDGTTAAAQPREVHHIMHPATSVNNDSRMSHATGEESSVLCDEALNSVAPVESEAESRPFYGYGGRYQMHSGSLSAGPSEGYTLHPATAARAALVDVAEDARTAGPATEQVSPHGAGHPASHASRGAVLRHSSRNAKRASVDRGDLSEAERVLGGISELSGGSTMMGRPHCDLEDSSRAQKALNRLELAPSSNNVLSPVRASRGGYRGIHTPPRSIERHSSIQACTMDALAPVSSGSIASVYRQPMPGSQSSTASAYGRVGVASGYGLPAPRSRNAPFPPVSSGAPAPPSSTGSSAMQTAMNTLQSTRGANITGLDTVDSVATAATGKSTRSQRLQVRRPKRGDNVPAAPVLPSAAFNSAPHITMDMVQHMKLAREGSVPSSGQLDSILTTATSIGGVLGLVEQCESARVEKANPFRETMDSITSQRRPPRLGGNELFNSHLDSLREALALPARPRPPGGSVPRSQDGAQSSRRGGTPEREEPVVPQREPASRRPSSRSRHDAHAPAAAAASSASAHSHSHSHAQSHARPHPHSSAHASSSQHRSHQSQHAQQTQHRHGDRDKLSLRHVGSRGRRLQWPRRVAHGQRLQPSAVARLQHSLMQGGHKEELVLPVHLYLPPVKLRRTRGSAPAPVREKSPQATQAPANPPPTVTSLEGQASRPLSTPATFPCGNESPVTPTQELGKTQPMKDRSVWLEPSQRITPPQPGAASSQRALGGRMPAAALAASRDGKPSRRERSSSANKRLYSTGGSTGTAARTTATTSGKAKQMNSQMNSLSRRSMMGTGGGTLSWLPCLSAPRTMDDSDHSTGTIEEAGAAAAAEVVGDVPPKTKATGGTMGSTHGSAAAGAGGKAGARGEDRVISSSAFRWGMRMSCL